MIVGFHLYLTDLKSYFRALSFLLLFIEVECLTKLLPCI